MDCIVTLLKGTIDNSELKKAGEVDFNLAAGETTEISGIWFSKKALVFLKRGNVSCTINGNSVTLPYELPRSTTPSGTIVITAIEDSVIGFTSAYNMDTISSSSGRVDWDMDVAQLKYAPITYAPVSGVTLLHGDIKYLYKVGNTQTNISVGNDSWTNNLYGDISVFGNCLSVTTLDLRYQSGVSGSVESLVGKYRENGKTTGSMTISVPTSGIITFNGAGITGLNKTLSWDATTITYNGTTINA